MPIDQRATATQAHPIASKISFKGDGILENRAVFINPTLTLNNPTDIDAKGLANGIGNQALYLDVSEYSDKVGKTTVFLLFVLIPPSCLY